MDKIKFQRAPELPSSPTSDDNGLWFIKPNGNNPMKLYLIWEGNPISMDAVDAATLAAALGLKADDNKVVKLAGTQTVTGAKTFNLAPLISVDAASGSEAVRKSQMDSALSNKADDNTVVKLTGNQTVAGKKTFSTVPATNQDASGNNDLVRKSQMDGLIEAIYTAIDDLETTLVDLQKPPVDIDCSANPNYPQSEAGDRYIVTADGKIGGASGEDVTVGDLIVCRTSNSGGTHAAVGDKFFILQTNIHDASETIKGYIQIATQSEVNAGTNTKKAVVPKTLATRLAALKSEIEGNVDSQAESKYVKYNGSQSLTSSQKNQARSNISAADDAAVVKLTGNQTVGGTKTFSSPVKVPAGTAAGDAVNKGQLDSGLANKADDNTVVKLTGNQTVGGKKTFSTVPASTQDASGANDLVRKSQLDAAVSSAVLEWSVDNWD